METIITSRITDELSNECPSTDVIKSILADVKIFKDEVDVDMCMQKLNQLIIKRNEYMIKNKVKPTVRQKYEYGMLLQIGTIKDKYYPVTLNFQIQCEKCRKSYDVIGLVDREVIAPYCCKSRVGFLKLKRCKSTRFRRVDGISRKKCAENIKKDVGTGNVTKTENIHVDSGDIINTVYSCCDNVVCGETNCE